jgi:hypothetical protein
MPGDVGGRTFVGELSVCGAGGGSRNLKGLLNYHVIEEFTFVMDFFSVMF